MTPAEPRVGLGLDVGSALYTWVLAPVGLPIGTRPPGNGGGRITIGNAAIPAGVL